MNNLSDAAAAGREAMDLCNSYASLAFGLAHWFLILALVVALAETAITLWGKVAAARAAPAANSTRGIDPGAAAKLLEALKGVLESLTKLPAWIAVFLAGLALLWLAVQRPEACPAPAGGPQQQQRPQQDRQTAPGSGATAPTRP